MLVLSQLYSICTDCSKTMFTDLMTKILVVDLQRDYQKFGQRDYQKIGPTDYQKIGQRLPKNWSD